MASITALLISGYFPGASAAGAWGTIDPFEIREGLQGGSHATQAPITES